MRVSSTLLVPTAVLLSVTACGPRKVETAARPPPVVPPAPEPAPKAPPPEEPPPQKEPAKEPRRVEPPPPLKEVAPYHQELRADEPLSPADVEHVVAGRSRLVVNIAPRRSHPAAMDVSNAAEAVCSL